MIPELDLQLLIDYSFRNKDGDLELDLKKANKDIIVIAKKYFWKPFEKQGNIKEEG